VTEDVGPVNLVVQGVEAAGGFLLGLAVGLLIFRNMPSLLPRKINWTASVIKVRVHRPSPCVHWVGIFKELNEATCRFTCVTACCFAYGELTTPCRQDADPLNYRANGQFPGLDFNPLE